MSGLAGRYVELLEVLTKHDVDFVICGGVACIIHGVNRVTADIDLFARLDRSNLERLLAAAKQLQLVPRIPEPIEALLEESNRDRWIADKNAVVFTLVDPNGPLQVDLFLDYPIPFEALKQRSDEYDAAGLAVRISSKQDLIVAKQAVDPMRKTDRRDIEDLQELIRNEEY